MTRLSIIIAGLSALIGQVSLVLAQTNLDPSIVSLVGNGVTVVVLAWYVIYDVRTRTPAMLLAFTAEQAKLRETFAQEQASLRETFKKEQFDLRDSYRVVVETIRSTFSAEQTATRQAFAGELTATRIAYEKEVSEMRSMLFENLKNMRQAVHDVKDTAQTLINSQAEERVLAKAAQQSSK